MIHYPHSNRLFHPCININLNNKVKQLTEKNKPLEAELKELGVNKTDSGGTQTGGRGGARNPNGNKCIKIHVRIIAGSWSSIKTRDRLIGY
jgi:hypothetical protein